MIEPTDTPAPAPDPADEPCQGQQPGARPQKPILQLRPKAPSMAKILEMYQGKHYSYEEWVALKAGSAEPMDVGRLIATVEMQGQAMIQAGPAIMREPFFFLLAAYLNKVYMPIFVEADVMAKYRDGTWKAEVKALPVGKNIKVWMDKTPGGIIVP